jgi:hypothetical protein
MSVILHIALCFVNWFVNVIHDPVDGNVNIGLDHCDRTTLERRGLSSKIRSGDSWRSENKMNTHTSIE